MPSARSERNEALVKQQLVSQTALDTSPPKSCPPGAPRGAEGAGQGGGKSVDVRPLDYDDLQSARRSRGVMISKDAQPGEIVSPVSAGGGYTRTGIATIVDMDSREVEVDVNEAYINRVKANQRVEAALDAYRGSDAARPCDQHRSHGGSHQGDRARAHRFRRARCADPAGHGRQGPLPRRSRRYRPATPPKAAHPGALCGGAALDEERLRVDRDDGRVERRAISRAPSATAQVEVLAGVTRVKSWYRR